MSETEEVATMPSSPPQSETPLLSPLPSRGASDIATLVRFQQALDIKCACVACVAILITFATKGDLLLTSTTSAKLQFAGNFLLVVCWLLWLIFTRSRTQTYMRWRHTLAMITRVMHFAWPVKQTLRFATLRVNIEPQPQGLLSTWIKEPMIISQGLQIVQLAVASWLFQLPLFLHVPTQIACLLVSCKAASVCKGTLLTSDVYEGRIQTAAYFAQAIPQALAGSPPLVPTSSLHRCIALGNYLRIVFSFILPTIVLLTLAPPVIIVAARTCRMERLSIRLWSYLCTPSPKLQRCVTDTWSGPRDESGELLLNHRRSSGEDDYTMIDEMAGTSVLYDLQKALAWFGLLSFAWVIAAVGV